MKTLRNERYALMRNPLTDLELYYWVQAVWGVRIPWTRVCPHHCSPFEVFSDAYFARHRRMLLVGSRGFSGKSYMLSLLGLTEMTTLGADVSILGGSGQQALRVHEAMTHMWQFPNAPSNMLLKDPTKYTTYLTNGAKAMTLMASQKSVRGPHPQRLRLDEIDEAEIAVIDAAQGQPMRGKTPDGEVINTNTLMVSTHQYPDGPVTFMLREAEKPGSKLKVYRYCLSPDTLVLTEHGEVPIAKVGAGDRVVSWDGERMLLSPVSWSGYTRTDETVRVKLSNGREIVCTPDHLVRTSEGWKEARSLTRGSYLVGSDLPWMFSDESGGAEELSQVENGRFVSGLLPEEQEEGSNLQGMWEKDRKAVDLVSTVLAQGAGEEIPSRPPKDGTSTSKAPEEGFQGRNLCGGAIGRAGSEVRHPSFSGCVHSGLLSTSAQCDAGSVRSLAHQGAEQISGAGCSQEENGGGGGPQVSDLVVRRDAYLGGATHTRTWVVSVTPGPVMDTYDITVPGPANFLAEGVIVHNCYKETMNPIDGWLDPDEVEQKRSEIPARMFASEYDLVEPSFGSRAIDTPSVEAVFDPNLGVVSGDEGRYYEIEAPRRDRDYVTGVDWAKKHDMTVIATFDATEEPWRLVAFERINRRPWPVMVGRLNKRLDEYGGKCAHDATGLGSVVEDYIQLPDHMRTQDLKPITMAGRQRNDLISNYINAVEKKLFLCPRIKYVYDQHLYATPDDVFSSSTAHHLPDTMAAFALANMFRKQRKRIALPPMNTDLIRNGSPWTSVGQL